VQKSKMVASELQLLISQYVNKIATKFKGLYLCFRDPGSPNNSGNAVRPNGKKSDALEVIASDDVRSG